MTTSSSSAKTRRPRRSGTRPASHGRAAPPGRVPTGPGWHHRGVRTLLLYVLALLLVGGLLFLAASFAFGRGEEMAPALPGGTPVELPDDRLASGADVRALRLAVVLRGYRMEEVDWVLDRLAGGDPPPERGNPRPPPVPPAP